jgi:hypothetical protein
MAELHVIGALRNKRAELTGILCQLEQQLVQQRADLAHLDATMRLFDPDIRPAPTRAFKIVGGVDVVGVGSGLTGRGLAWCRSLCGG